MKKIQLRKVLSAVIAAGAVFSISSVHAVGVTIDGDMFDMSGAAGVPPSAIGNDGVDGDNNGFDITETYVHYDSNSDTFFIGFRVAGNIGTAGGNEGTSNTFCNAGLPGSFAGDPGVFDGCEMYGVGIDIGSNNGGSEEFDLRLKGDSIKDSVNGTETQASLINPSLATFDYIIAETLNDGIEFSITGLNYDVTAGATIYFFSSTANSFVAGQDEASLVIQAVPVPAAVWLFGSGLIGLLGFARRRK